MYHFKLLGLVLSSLLTLTPGVYFDEPTPTPTTTTDYDGTEIEFPFTRLDKAVARVAYRVDDLGEVSIGGLYHNYNIDYNIQIYCSSACSLQEPAGPIEAYSNYVEYHIYSRVSNKTPNEMIQLLRSVSSKEGPQAANTYQSKGSIGMVNISLNVDYGSITIPVYFPAISPIDYLEDIDYDLHDFKVDYELVNKRRLIYQLVLDKDVDAEYQRRVLQLLNQNDVDGAYNLVNNYYNTYSVTDTEEKETVVNNYNTKETTLNNYFNTENNFSNQVENDFQTQQQALPDVNQSIEDLQDSSFLQSANWVTQQFNRMTVGNIFGKFLVFSLFTGFILALIGRFKR